MKRFKILWLLSQTKALQFCADDAVWCNGVKDCIDGRDEIGCANYNCADFNVSLKYAVYNLVSFSMFRPFIAAWKKSALTQVCCAMVTPIAAMETMNERATLT